MLAGLQKRKPSAGEFEAAAEASLRLWFDGPRRTPADVDPALRAAVAEMVLRSYRLQRHGWEAGAREEEVVVPPVQDRLQEIRCPTLVIVGVDDVTDMRSIATHVANSIDRARLVEVEGAAHLPGHERPDEVNALLCAFLAER